MLYIKPNVAFFGDVEEYNLPIPQYTTKLVPQNLEWPHALYTAHQLWVMEKITY